MRIHQVFRSFRQAPRFAVSVCITLALGLTTALLMWSVLWQAVLQPLPYGRPSELFVLGAQRDGQSSALSAAEAEQLGRYLPQGSTLASFFWNGTTYIGGERPEVLTTLTVSDNFFRVLNVKPILGRDLRPEDADSNNIVISESTWRRYFGADPGVIGAHFKEDGGDSTIVGVVPASLSFPARDLGYYKAIDWQAMRENQQSYLEGRFLNGVLRVPAAMTAVPNWMARIDDAHAQLRKAVGIDASAHWRLLAVDFEQSLRGDVRAPLYALAALSLLVLLISGVNAAHMVLTRANQRSNAFAVMDALGASRGTQLRVILVEVAILSLVALALAFALASVTLKFAPNLADSGLPVDPSTGAAVLLHPALLILGAVFCAVLMLLAGVLPAWRVAKSGTASVLREVRHGARTKAWLAVPGIALSLVALVCAVFFMQSAQTLRDQDLGLDVQNTVAAQLFLRGEWNPEQWPQWRARVAQTLSEARNIPGAQSVAITSGLPFNPVGNLVQSFSGGPAMGAQEVLRASLRSVAGDLIATLGYTLRAGRALGEQDHAQAAASVLINERFAEAYFGQLAPIGRYVQVPGSSGEASRAFQVVGVLADARFEDPSQAPKPELWLPYAQYPTGQFALAVRGAPSALKAVQDLIWRTDPRQAIFRAYALGDDLRKLTAAPRFFARFAGLFAWLALALAVLGSYAILSHSLAQRRHEFALRTALGANAGRIVSSVVKESLQSILPGVALGLGLAIALASLLNSQLYGEPSTLVACTIAAALVFATSISASLLAARGALNLSLNAMLKAH